MGGAIVADTPWRVHLEQALAMEKDGDVAGALLLYRTVRASAGVSLALAAELDVIINEVSDHCAPAVTEHQPANDAAGTPAVAVVSLVMPDSLACVTRGNVERLRQLRALGGPARNARCLAFLPDGTGVAVATADGRCMIWALSAGRYQSAALSGVRVALAGGGSQLVTGGADGHVRLYAVDGATMQGTWPLHQTGVTALAACGSLLASGCREGAVHLWRPDGSAGPRSLEDPEGDVAALAFSPEGNLLAAGYTDGLRVWRVKVGARMKAFKGSSGSVTSVAFSYDGRLLAAAGVDGTLRVWPIADPTNVMTLRHPRSDSPVTCVAFIPESDVVVTGSADRRIRFWSSDDGELLRVVGEHLHPVEALAVSDCGTWVASGSYEGVRLWGVR